MSPRRSLLSRVFLANALILVVAFALLASLPITVSWPATGAELTVLVGGLAVMLVANLLLMRRVLTPLRRLRHAMTAVDPLRPGQRIDVGARSIEVADLTRAFNEMLDRLEEERRESTRRTQSAQEQERRALSLELHDQVGQNLTALLLQLDVASRSATPEQRQALDASVDTVRECLDQVRGIVRRLRPEALDDLGLSRAIEHLCDRVEHDSGIVIEHALDPELPALSSDAQLVVYRVTQESLTNVVRHSRARRVTVQLGPRDDGVRLSLTDDGTGTAPGHREGSGIRGMRERALMIGAAFRLGAGESSGTRVVLDIPKEETRP